MIIRLEDDDEIKDKRVKNIKTLSIKHIYYFCKKK